MNGFRKMLTVILSRVRLIECRRVSRMQYLHGTVEPFLNYVSKIDCKTRVLHWEECSVQVVFNSRQYRVGGDDLTRSSLWKLQLNHFTPERSAILLHRQQLTTGTIFQGLMDSVWLETFRPRLHFSCTGYTSKTVILTQKWQVTAFWHVIIIVFPSLKTYEFSAMEEHKFCLPSV